VVITYSLVYSAPQVCMSQCTAGSMHSIALQTYYCECVCVCVCARVCIVDFFFPVLRGIEIFIPFGQREHLKKKSPKVICGSKDPENNQRVKGCSHTNMKLV